MGIVVAAVLLVVASGIALSYALVTNLRGLESDTSAHVDAAMLGTLVSSYLSENPDSTAVDVVQRGDRYVLEDAETAFDLGEASEGVVLGDFSRDGEQWCLWVQADNGTAVEFRPTSGPVEGRCLLSEATPEPTLDADSADLRAAAESDVLALADVIERWFAGISSDYKQREIWGPPVVWQEDDTYLINPAFAHLYPNPEFSETIELPASEGVQFLDESGFGPQGWCVAVVTDGGYELRYSASDGLAEGRCLS
ncbi:hypothetical protein [Demequina zhanjiangensis]|uniref:Type II secretory pathway, pseudopilin PulG n=1 Tax=Demequina zhanjiangensis TaxID=3051659 RepID=A0ABT8G362_9MICO|nr:hypothetical protein [Demequina sp. SYSU T00b26]MDN4473517.1 hypothetical protein [Demequina sp. SYSU T00b26]